MREYEIVMTFLNACAGEAYPQRSFAEAALRDPADYIRQKHGKDFGHFIREDLPDGRTVYAWRGAVTYIYEFTEL